MKIKDCFNVKNKILLNEGITNTSFLIDNKYVFRDKKEIIDPFNKPINEKKAISLLEQSTYVEKVIEYDETTGKKLSLYIDKTTRISSHLSSNHIAGIVKILKDLHSKGEADFDFDPFERINFYKAAVSEKINPQYEEAVLNSASQLYKKYPHVFCHNDLVKGNILLKDDDVYLLDFEFSGNNIELFDIASFLSENDLDNETKLTFLSYFPQYQKKDILVMIMFEDILWYYWGMYLYKITNKAIYLDIAKEKKSRINNI